MAQFMRVTPFHPTLSKTFWFIILFPWLLFITCPPFCAHSGSGVTAFELAAPVTQTSSHALLSWCTVPEAPPFTTAPQPNTMAPGWASAAWRAPRTTIAAPAHPHAAPPPCSAPSAPRPPAMSTVAAGEGAAWAAAARPPASLARRLPAASTRTTRTPAAAARPAPSHSTCPGEKDVAERASAPASWADSCAATAEDGKTPIMLS